MSTTTTTGRRGASTRGRRAAALTAAACAAAVVLTPTAGAAEPALPVTQNRAAAFAVGHLTEAESVSAARIPDDFAELFGYLPEAVDGLLANPGGDCSSPVPLPAEFDTACKAHDLGYDLLRYADLRGEPLGPWARQALDATLDRRMRAACDTRAEPVSRARCHAMAVIADTVVDLNSRRQDYGAPVTESLRDASGWVLGSAGVGLLGLGALLALVLGRTRRRVNTADSVEVSS